MRGRRERHDDEFFLSLFLPFFPSSSSPACGGKKLVHLIFIFFNFFALIKPGTSDSAPFSFSSVLVRDFFCFYLNILLVGERGGGRERGREREGEGERENVNASFPLLRTFDFTIMMKTGSLSRCYATAAGSRLLPKQRQEQQTVQQLPFLPFLSGSSRRTRVPAPSAAGASGRRGASRRRARLPRRRSCGRRSRSTTCFLFFVLVQEGAERGGTVVRRRWWRFAKVEERGLRGRKKPKRK